MNSNIQKIALSLLIVSPLLLTACSKEGEAPAPAPAAPAAPAQASGHLTKEQISSNIEQVGSVAYNAAADTLTFKIKVQNKGTAAWPATGANPVSVGIVQLQPAAPGASEPARGQEARAPLAGDLTPNGEAEVTAVVPGTFAVGHQVQFELVQEGVAWFGFNFHEPVLIVGPFTRCADGKGICDAEGKPVAAQ